MIKLIDILKEIRVLNPSAIPTHLPFRYDSYTWPRIAQHLKDLGYYWAYDSGEIIPNKDAFYIKLAKNTKP